MHEKFIYSTHIPIFFLSLPVSAPLSPHLIPLSCAFANFHLTCCGDGIGRHTHTHTHIKQPFGNEIDCRAFGEYTSAILHSCTNVLVPHTKRLAVAQFQEIDRRAPACLTQLISRTKINCFSLYFRYTARVIASHTRTHAHSWAHPLCISTRIYIDISHIVHVVRTFPCHLFRAAVLSYSAIQQMHFLFSSPPCLCFLSCRKLFCDFFSIKNEPKQQMLNRVTAQ